MGGGRAPAEIDPGSRPAVNDGTLARTASPSPGPIGFHATSGGGKGGGKEAGPSLGLPERIVAYAAARVGQHDGRECYTLVDHALRTSGARRPGEYNTEITDDTDYYWGTPVDPPPHPGDVIQFRNFTCEWRWITEDDSGAIIEEETQTEERPHHTAIVESTGAHDAVTVLEQNHPRGAPVTRTTLYLNGHTTRSGTEVTQITVGGTYFLYRPEPA